MKLRDVRLNPQDKVTESPRHTTSMGLPVPVHHHLDQLLETVDVMNTSRAEIVAMLIANAALDEDKLIAALSKYRRLKVGELLDLDENDSVVVPIHGPGRRKRGAG